MLIYFVCFVFALRLLNILTHVIDHIVPGAVPFKVKLLLALRVKNSYFLKKLVLTIKATNPMYADGITGLVSKAKVTKVKFLA